MPKNMKSILRRGAQAALVILLTVIVSDLAIWMVKSHQYEKAVLYTWKIVSGKKERPYISKVDLQKVYDAQKVTIMNNGDKGEYILFIPKGKKDKIDNMKVYRLPSSIEKEIIAHLNEKGKPFFYIDAGEMHAPRPIIMDYFVHKTPVMFALILSVLIFFSLTPADQKRILEALGATKTDIEVLKPEDIEGDMDDIYGYEEIKRELKQIQEVLNHQERYSAYGLGQTQNILFSGPPGTGKTKMAGYFAKAIGAPIIIASGNMETGYVGGGASTIRKIYSMAEELSKKSDGGKVVVFIDEAQNMLKKRGQWQEKWADDTNNELLAFLDGVRSKKSGNIITILSSNFDETNMEMDDAMSRRFKKKIFFRLPNYSERVELFKNFLNRVDKKLLAEEIDVDKLAKITSGASPAIIENIVQEAGFLAGSRNEKITTKSLIQAFEIVNIGMANRSDDENQEHERNIVAVHELGHFLTAFVEEYSEVGDVEEAVKRTRLIKISSEPLARAGSLGYVLSGSEDKFLHTSKDLKKEIVSLYGGAAAEEVIFGDVSTGSSNDIDVATNIIKEMVTGLSMHSDAKLNRNEVDLYADEDAYAMHEIASSSYNRAKEIIRLNRDLLEFLKIRLLEQWTLDTKEVTDLICEYINTKEQK